MSQYQSRAERSESTQYRKTGRSGSSNQQRQFSGGVSTKGGGGASSAPTNRSSKKYNSNAPVGQPGGGYWGANSGDSSAARAVQNGVHQQQPTHRVSDTPATSTSSIPKPMDAQSQKITRAVPKPPASNVPSTTAPSNVTNANSEPKPPSTPGKAPGNTSNSIGLQFGSLSPGLMNGMQIPARTSSAPPNLDEQKKDQARYESLRTDPALPTPSVPKQHFPRKDAGIHDQRIAGESYLPSNPKRDVQVSTAPHGIQAQKPLPHPIPGMPMQLKYHQPQIPVQFGGPNPLQSEAILNKLTPQNFEKLFEQVKQVNIDNVITLSGVVSQIFDKALMEPTFCEMYANLCFDLATELPELSVDNQKITFKRLLLNKCQEEFEWGEREEEEANKVEEEGEVKQSAEEREEKRLRARRRMLGNIRLIGELFKKRMLTERIMHECINKLLGQNQNPDEENIEALCKLMSTIGEMIDHPKAKGYMDAYYDIMTQLSNNMKLSSRLRFMLKDAIDLRKNKWQQRRKVEGPKKIEEVHRDAAQERQAQARLGRVSSMGNPVKRGPTDFGPRSPSMLPSPNSQIGGFRGAPPQQRGHGSQDVRVDERHSLENRNMSVPLPQRQLDDSITLGPQGGLARGMAFRGQPLSPNVPFGEMPSPGDGRSTGPGQNDFGSVPAYSQREDLMPRYMTDRFGTPPIYNQSHPQERNITHGMREVTNIDRASDRSLHTSAPPQGGIPSTHDMSTDKAWPEEHLHDKSLAAIKEFYSGRDENEVALCIKDLNTPSFYPTMISIWVVDSFERKDVERDMLAKLLVDLTKPQDRIISEDQLTKGFESVLSVLEDAVNDAPRAAEFLGRIFAKVILENVISLSDIGRLVCEGGEEKGQLVEVGLAAEVLGSIFDAIKSEKVSAGSSASSCSSAHNYGRQLTCSCGLPTKLLTSKTPRNRGRRFVTCPQPMGNRCDTWFWVEPPTCNMCASEPEVSLSLVSELKTTIEVMSSREAFFMAKLEDLEQNEQALVKRNEDLHRKLSELQLVVARPRFLSQNVVCVLLVCSFIFFAATIHDMSRPIYALSKLGP